MQQEWFSTWFDSEFYHKLYQHRDETEADAFIQKLVLVMKLPKYAETLDVACGKGRHSMMLHECGMHVTGVDLSKNSITQAQKLEEEGLQFFVHDMRNTLGINMYDAVFNLFTSFGYFASEQDNRLAARTLTTAARKGGYVLIDFLNAEQVKNHVGTNIIESEQIVDGITFSAKKYIQNNKVIKEIDVLDEQGIHHKFSEEVQLIDMAMFEKYFGSTCTLEKSFGDYQLNSYDASTSPRLILLFKKK
jgi:2-polyprenyl-3-methyl-5-hydroxy-6-metoxy-1,4-benzoquinol methylase